MGIPVSAPFWGMNWGVTLAQLELMAADIPVTDYHREKKGASTDGSGKRKTAFRSPSKESLEETARRWEAKHGKQGKITINK